MNKEKFFEEFLTLFERQEFLSKFGYNKITKTLSGISPRYFYSRKTTLESIEKNLLSTLDISPKEAKKERGFCVKNFGLSYFNIFFYETMNNEWLRKNINCKDPLLLKKMVENGGILITFHSYHHNTIGSVLGLYGGEIFGISAAKNPEHDNEIIRKYHINIMHNNSEKNFGGGHYLFLNNLKEAIRGIKRGLKRNSLIIGLADFPAQNKTISANFMGKKILIQRWLFDIAASHGKNIYFGILEGRNPRKPLSIKISSANTAFVTAEELVQQYVDFLSENVRENPACWQGWEWLHLILENKQ